MDLQPVWLIAGVLAIGSALGAAGYWWSKRREKKRREQHLEVLGIFLRGQESSPDASRSTRDGDKTDRPKVGKPERVVPPPAVGKRPAGSGGAAGTKPSVSRQADNKQVDNAGSSPPAPGNPTAPGQPPANSGGKAKQPGGALVPYVPPDQVQDRHLRVNNYDLFAPVKEPIPLITKQREVRQAYDRAKKRIELSVEARRAHDHEAAVEHAEAALDEVHSGMKRDHWYAADILNMLGCLKYDKGFYLEARELWNQAEEVALEWPDQCTHIAPTIEKNLKLVRGMLGF